MSPISSSELDTLCKLVKTATPKYYPSCSDWLNDLYYTGCRPKELLDLSRWEMIIGFPIMMKLTPFKGNSHRFFEWMLMSTSFRNAFDNNEKPYNGLSYRQLEYSMQLINPAGNMAVGNRDTIAYIYRYNRVSLYRDEGKTWEEIRDLFGWYNPLMPYSYAERTVLVQVPPPW